MASSGLKSSPGKIRDPDQLLPAPLPAWSHRSPSKPEQVAIFPPRITGFALFVADLLELRLLETLPYHAGMLFGDPHIGKAIAILRKPSFNQKDLAAALGIENGTMNKYEKGRQPVPEEVLREIARLIHREVIEILDTAYAIFRFNYLRDEAQRTGADLEEMIARYDARATVEEIHAARVSYLATLDVWERKKTELAGQQKIKGFTVLRHVIEREEEKKRDARRRTPKDQSRPESPG